MEINHSYDNAVKRGFLDGLRPDRSGNSAEQAAHLLAHYFRMCMDGQPHEYNSDHEIEISAIVEKVINASVGYSVLVAIDQVKLMLKGSGPAVPALRTVTLHPQYPGAVETRYMRGADFHGDSDMVINVGQDCVSQIAHNYYEGISSRAGLQNRYIALRYTLPDDFISWASENAIQIGFRTEGGSYLNSSVSAIAYKSGKPHLVASSSHNAMTEWGVIVLADVDSERAAWSPGDFLELYIDLASRSNYYARVGAIKFSYMGSGSSPAVTVDEVINEITKRMKMQSLMYEREAR